MKSMQLEKQASLLKMKEIMHWLTAAAIVGPVFFTLVWFTLGFISPGYPLWDLWIAPYSALSQPISGLGLGQTAPVMNTAFVLVGVFMIVGVIGVLGSMPELSWRTRWACTLLLSLPGIGAIMDGLFTLESFMLHMVGFLLALSVIIGFLVTGLVLRGVPQWKQFGSWLILGSPLTLLLAVLFFATFNPEAAGTGVGMGGLAQRILILQIHFWFVALGWKAFKYSA